MTSAQILQQYGIRPSLTRVMIYDYLREHNHEWKVKRYPRCPENRTDFPRILPSAIDFMCDRFEQTQNSLSSIKFIREV